MDFLKRNTYLLIAITATILVGLFFAIGLAIDAGNDDDTDPDVTHDPDVNLDDDLMDGPPKDATPSSWEDVDLDVVGDLPDLASVNDYFGSKPIEVDRSNTGTLDEATWKFDGHLYTVGFYGGPPAWAVEVNEDGEIPGLEELY